MTDIKLDCDDWPFCNGAKVIGMKLPEYLAWASNTGTYAKQLLLPSIQRGFVWKPKQIVDLWDSLLRGMPIGSLMVSKLAAGSGQRARNIGDKSVSVEVKSESIGLLDGQQRTLSMLMGWAKEHSKQHCLWIELNKKDTESGSPFKLRLTTRAQPFGFDPLSQTRLSRHDRKKAREQYDEKTKYRYKEKRDYELFDLIQQNQSDQPRPYVAGGNHGLFIRLTDAWDAFRESSNANTFLQKLSEGIGKEQINHKPERLYFSFERIAVLEVPLVLIPDHISQGDEGDEGDALILLFERIGSNATKLTPEDLLFSMIKQQWPEAHDLVEKVKDSNFHYPMNPSDYVMTAFRLAAAQTGKIGDNPRPRPIDFHRHLGDLLVTIETPGPLRKYLAKDSALVNAFNSLHSTLIYQGGDDNGIPNYMLPHLSRGLIQVLLRWIMLNDEQIIAENRERIIAFSLFWYLHVWNEDKASKKAFEIAGVEGAFPVTALYKALTQSETVNEIGLALPLMSPEKLKEILIEYKSSSLLTKDQIFIKERSTVQQSELYRKFCWWRKPVLLWLQRKYVQEKFGELSLDADLTDEDVVPYDYDHLCPQDHWGKHWSSIKGNCTDTAFQNTRSDTGNCIGNLHVLESSLNRSFGNDSLAIKVTKSPEKWKPDDSKLYDDQNGEHEELWRAASPQYEDAENDEYHWVWDKVRLQAFQHAVYRRAFNLYTQYYAACSSILPQDAGQEN